MHYGSMYWTFYVHNVHNVGHGAHVLFADILYVPLLQELQLIPSEHEKHPDIHRRQLPVSK